MPEVKTARVELTLTFTMKFTLDSHDPVIAEDYPDGMAAEDAVEEIIGDSDMGCGYDLGWLPADVDGLMEAEWIDQEENDD